MVTAVYVPRWGVTMEKATVVAWLAEEGERVTKGQELLELETEKMVNVVEAPGDGVLRVILFAEGEAASVGALVAVIAEPDEVFDVDVLREASPTSGKAAASVREKREARPATRTGRGRVRASPAARRLAEDHGVDLADLAGTGPEGSISREDVERAVVDAVARSVEEGFADVAGMRLHYVAAGGAATGLRVKEPPVVFVHGIAGSAILWQANITAPAAWRRVVALDLPGHGRSDKPEAAYDLDFLAGALAGFLDALELPAVALVGHSLGGHLCLRLALRDPGRVAGLVLVDSGGLGPEIRLGFLQALLAGVTREAVEAMLRGLFEDTGLASRSMIEATLEMLEQPGASRAVAAAVAAVAQGSRQEENLAERLAELPMPVLLAWGGKDAVLPVSQAQAAAAAAPRAELWIAEESGHCPQLEAAPRFNRRLLEFLEATGGHEAKPKGDEPWPT
ncbi:MAG: acetoin dehydrogenase dihydrolipoyllysine-residue acetyltransferase subunit [Deltaproteobacteria bacterium]|nr:acetoin dehydrogenase dihydrolipoyllysine-residue acetyltransferase subunit [Deltaproteobacteria bacterium]